MPLVFVVGFELGELWTQLPPGIFRLRINPPRPAVFELNTALGLLSSMALSFGSTSTPLNH
ncbi:MAG: hypothetical protein M2R45_01563 [Verrucomicrobia subdivision 3 bacterium]|nr:hypothetical protein [Limisphaerales bacterium]MCS1413309.1 hypothetical protein [Limisphaerales bacterium]